MNSARRLTVAAALTAVLTLSACSGTPAASPTDEPAAAGFPVTIPSALGDAVITETPERIVTIGQGSAETAIALGITPVGIGEYSWGADPETGYLPWIHDAVTAAGDELPTQFDDGTSTGEIDLDTVVELEPDLILAPWSGITQEQFDTLNQIAPTVAYPEKAWTITWTEQIQLIADAVGQPDQAQGLIDGINAEFADVAAAHPEFADTTFSYIYTTPSTLGVFLPGEQRVAMLDGMGLVQDSVVDTLDEADGTASAIIGYERADELNNSDLIVTFYSDDAAKEEALSNDLYSSIPAIANDAVVASSDESFVTASSLVNPLTVPWVLSDYVDLVTAAMDNVQGE
ncbi:MAG: iron-siderophore ABC transporter substrate-binding protein [Mycetocola sp.]